jgi:hypothetical protein
MPRIRTPRRPDRIPRGVVLGLLLMLCGGALLAHNMRWMHIEDLLQYWPVGLVLLGLAHLLNRGLLSTWGHILIAVGTFLLAGFLGYDDQVERYWPLAIVYVGVIMTLRALLRRPAPLIEPPPESPDCERLP